MKLSVPFYRQEQSWAPFQAAWDRRERKGVIGWKP